MKCQLSVCNGCRDLLMMSMNLINIAFLNIKRSDYCFVISRINKNEAINLIQYTNLTEKQNIIKHNFKVWRYQNLKQIHFTAMQILLF